MSDLKTVEGLLTDVMAKLNSTPQAMTEEQIKTIMSAHLMESLKDPEFARKMKFTTGPDPRLIGSKFARHNLGIGDVEWLYDVMTSMRGKYLSDGSTHKGPSDELENCFKSISEALYIPQEEIIKIDRQALDGVFPRISKANNRAFDAALKAMDSAESGFGSQLVGAQYVGELWEAARKESTIFNLLTPFEMTAPTAYLPVEVDFPEMLFVSESTANNSSNYTTTKTGSQRVQVDAKKFVIHQMWSGEMEEDSIIPFLQFLRTQAAKSIAYYLDSLVLNGDTTNAGTGNINLDDADPADTKHYLAFDGIRHVGIVDNTNNQKDAAGAITYNILRAAKGRMVDTTNKVDWGHPGDPNDLVYVADIDSADRIAELPEVLTMDKYGVNATVLTGETVKIGRHPLIVSIAMSKTEADGKVSTTGSNNTKGQVVPFNRKAFVPGWRRRVKLETERLPGTDQTRLVYSLRLGMGRFSPSGAASGIEGSDCIFNITV